jgi:hypothetical protein
MTPFELLATMQALVGLDDDDCRRLREIGPLLMPHAPVLAEVFYAALDSIPESKAILDSEPGRRLKLHQTLMEWYAQIFSGNYDEAYAQRRWIIGLVHVKVGISPMYVVASMENVYRFSARQVIQLSSQLAGPHYAYIESLTKMLNIDLAFIEQSYAESTVRAMSAEMGADQRIFQRFASRGAGELLESARAGRFL